MNNKTCIFIFMIIVVTLYLSGCKRNIYSREDYPDMRAYGHTWKYYRVTRTERTHPLMSGHGILVPQELEYVTKYIENENGEKVNIDLSLYAIHANGEIIPFPDTIESRRYIQEYIKYYDDKIYIHVSSQANSIYDDCNRMYIGGKPELTINLGYPYEFLGEFDPATKRFILDRVLPMPITSDKHDSEYYKLLNGKPVMDISVMVEKSEKYVCK